MKKSKKGFCKNGYPISKGQILLMGRVVGVCDECGHRYLHSEMPVFYVGDKVSKSKERFHVYQFASPLICGGCKKWISSINVACRPLIEIKNDWSDELNRYLKIEESKENK